MPFTAEQQKQIIEKLGTKILRPCPSCGEYRRQLLPDLLLFTVQPAPIVSMPGSGKTTHIGELMQGIGSNKNALNWLSVPTGLSIAPSALPCIVVVCMNCGHTEFYNVHVLEVAQALGIPAPGVPLGR